MRTLRSTLSRHAGAAGLATLLAVGLGACAANTAPAADSSASASTAASATTSGMPGMSGMDEPMYTGNGLSASSGGFTLVPADATSTLPADRAVTLSFRIEDAMGMAVTSFQDDQTKLMHFYVVRSDLAGFQHVHPTMAADGTWSASLAAMQPGAYRAYASFITKNSGGTAVALVLSEQFTVAGTVSTAAALPAPSATTEVDGYTVALSGDLMSGMQHTLTATITKDGVPVTDLQPYLDSYAHLTAFHQGDMAFAHLHPQGTVNGDHGGPTLTFEATMAEAGDYRLYLQFQTGGVLHTAAITVHAA
ncbi:hypothetical protein KDK95_01865 [Actinospica sp. MGRD01-02]|uniref:Heavy metal-binding domain-containing protein n=1 Tax=Actinospica acidithermotolerans TaxID=2828514 RepID=A0A941E2N1_9ACTN|nr:hypothetical protein [Actinospica acidithermotolerans]MBR7825035.1 hypothetical protein [Actinospica acidithermotolerans]